MTRSPMENNNLGGELGSKGLWDDAIREHEEAVKTDPENAMFRQNLSSANLHYADLLASRKKWHEAIDHYREALYADPANLPADAHLDDCLRALGKNPKESYARDAPGGVAGQPPVVPVLKVLAELPGVSQGNLELAANTDMLCIAGKRQVASGDKVIMSELPTGSFKRRVRLPYPVQVELSDASLKDGILTVTMPRWRSAETQKKISVSTTERSYQ